MAEALVGAVKRGDVEATAECLEQVAKKDKEVVLYCACLAGRLGQAQVLPLLVKDERVWGHLWSKRDLKVKLGSIDLAEQGVTKTVTLAQEILHAICKGGSVPTAQAFFGCLSKSQLAKLVRKAGRNRADTDLSGSLATSDRPSRKGTLTEVTASRSSQERRSALSFSGEEDEEEEDENEASGAHAGLVGQIFESIAQRTSDQRGVFEIAAAEGHFELIKYLADDVGFDLQAHAQVTLDAATLRGSLRIVKYLLEKPSINENASLSLTKVLRCNNRELVKLWIELADIRPLEQERHSKMGCDKCHTVPIIGLRYKSIGELKNHYTSFDLCHECLQKPWETLPEDVQKAPLLKVANGKVLTELHSCIEWLNSNLRTHGRPRARTASMEEEFPELDGVVSKETTALAPSSSSRSLFAGSRRRKSIVETTHKRGERGSLVRKFFNFVGKAGTRTSLPKLKAGKRPSEIHEACTDHQDPRSIMSPFQAFALVLQTAIDTGALAAYFPPDPSVDAKQVLLVHLFRNLWKPTVLLRILRACQVTPTRVMQPLFLWCCREERDTALPLIQRSSDLLGLSKEQASELANNAHSKPLFTFLCRSFEVENPTKEFDLLFEEGKDMERLVELMEEKRVNLAHAAKRSVIREIRNEEASYLGEAILNGYVELAKALLEYPGVEPWFPNNDAIWSACKVGNEEFVRMFLENDGWIKVRSDGEHEAICNKCGEMIDGTRYKCSSCFDFDLCFTCMRRGAAQGHNKDHAETPIVAVRDPIFWECPRVAIHAGHVEVVRLLFEDSRFTVFPIYFLWAVGSVEMTKLLLEFCSDTIVDLDSDLIVSQAAMNPAVLSIILADGRFSPTDNALLTAIINNVVDSVGIIFDSGYHLDKSAFEKAIPFLLLQKKEILEEVLEHVPEDWWVDVIRAVTDENMWLLVTPEKLDLAMSHKALQPRSNEEMLRFLEAAVYSGRPSLLKFWLTRSEDLRGLVMDTMEESMAVLVALTSRLPLGSREKMKSLIRNAMEEQEL